MFYYLKYMYTESIEEIYTSFHYAGLQTADIFIQKDVKTHCSCFTILLVWMFKEWPLKVESPL